MPGWRKPGRSGSAPLSPLFTGLNKGPVGRKLVQALGRVQEFAPSSAVEENVYYMCVYCPDVYLLVGCNSGGPLMWPNYFALGGCEWPPKAPPHGLAPFDTPLHCA